MTRYLRNWFKQAVSSKDRFRTGNKPTQSVFDKLFDSTGFVDDPDDTATQTKQGFVRTATDDEAEARTVVAVDSLAMSVAPHQIPSYTSSDSTITIAEGQVVVSGKHRKEVDIINPMTVSEADPGNQPVVVNQAGPGQNVTIEWDPTQDADNGKVKSSASGPKQYLLNSLISSDGSIEIEGTPDPVLADQIDLKISKTGRSKEVTMWYGTAAQMATQFPAGYCTTAGDAWNGWAICDGGTYNGTTTPDLRGLFPVGYHAVDYPNIGTVNYKKDGSGDEGAAEITLTSSQSGIPAHSHGITDPGHTHPYTNYPPVADDVYDAATNDTLTQNDNANAANTTSNTTGITIDNNVAADAVDPHENRPPFFTVLFVMYVG